VKYWEIIADNLKKAGSSLSTNVARSFGWSEMEVANSLEQ